MHPHISKKWRAMDGEQTRVSCNILRFMGSIVPWPPGCDAMQFLGSTGGHRSARPVAIITGPSEVSAACPFNLSAHESYDVPGILFLAVKIQGPRFPP